MNGTCTHSTCYAQRFETTYTICRDDTHKQSMTNSFYMCQQCVTSYHDLKDYNMTMLIPNTDYSYLFFFAQTKNDLYLFTYHR